MSPKFKMAQEEAMAEKEENVNFDTIMDVDEFKAAGGIVLNKPRGALVVMFRTRNTQYYGWSISMSLKSELENGKASTIRLIPPIISVSSNGLNGKMFVLESCENIKNNPHPELGENVRLIHVPVAGCDYFAVADHFDDTFKANLKSEGIWVIE